MRRYEVLEFENYEFGSFSSQITGDGLMEVTKDLNLYNLELIDCYRVNARDLCDIQKLLPPGASFITRVEL
jgi:hypothetical protein